MTRSHRGAPWPELQATETLATPPALAGLVEVMFSQRLQLAQPVGQRGDTRQGIGWMTTGLNEVEMNRRCAQISSGCARSYQGARHVSAKAKSHTREKQASAGRDRRCKLIASTKSSPKPACILRKRGCHASSRSSPTTAKRRALSEPSRAPSKQPRRRRLQRAERRRIQAPSGVLTCH